MAEETPAVEDFTDDLVDEVAQQVVGGTTRDQMLGAFSGISRRLVEMHNGRPNSLPAHSDSYISIYSC